MDPFSPDQSRNVRPSRLLAGASADCTWLRRSARSQYSSSRASDFTATCATASTSATLSYTARSPRPQPLPLPHRPLVAPPHSPATDSVPSASSLPLPSGVVSVTGLTPLLAFLWANAATLPPEFRVGLAIFYCAPTALSSGVALVREARFFFRCPLLTAPASHSLPNARRPCSLLRARSRRRRIKQQPRPRLPTLTGLAVPPSPPSQAAGNAGLALLLSLLSNLIVRSRPPARRPPCLRVPSCPAAP